MSDLLRAQAERDLNEAVAAARLMEPWPTYDSLPQQLRANAFKAEADPLFFKWQRGEATEQEWRDKVDEIRARFPDIELEVD